jgi:hypothetical protein
LRNKQPKQDDEDDAPAYIMEDTNQSLTKAEYEALVAGKDSKDEDAGKNAETPVTADSRTQATDAQPVKDNVADLSKNTRKRKAVKVIAGDDEAGSHSSITQTDAKVIKKPKKKNKPVKLTFGDEDEG